MIKIIVFDSNTIISAHLLPQSITRRAFNKAQEVGLLVYSHETFSEFAETFKRPKFDKYITEEERRDAIRKYELSGQLINVTSPVEICRDPKDNKFLSLAKDANANLIVTGDKDLLTLNPFEGIRIISPAEFLREEL